MSPARLSNLTNLSAPPDRALLAQMSEQADSQPGKALRVIWTSESEEVWFELSCLVHMPDAERLMKSVTTSTEAPEWTLSESEGPGKSKDRVVESLDPGPRPSGESNLDVRTDRKLYISRRKT